MRLGGVTELIPTQVARCVWVSLQTHLSLTWEPEVNQAVIRLTMCLISLSIAINAALHNSAISGLRPLSTRQSGSEDVGR